MTPQLVLIVDDKEENLYFLRAVLEGAGFAVESAVHGADAMDCARRRPPALVVADILMPVMDGFALCREWRKDELLRSIPFVFYTATYTDDRDRDFALSIGADDFIVKPQEPDELLRMLQDVLGRAAPRDIPASATAEESREQDGVFLQQYNQALVRKLEAKMEQLERDIAARKKAEAENDRLQAQLNQMQKIDSVGRLAGGVAHDFNNMLQVILGHVELALRRASPDQPIHEDLVQIKNAAERSSDLTRQLLAFARKQTVSPKVLDVNETIGGLVKFLSRLIGENVELAWKPGEDAGSVRIDPSQVDQLLANLCVNARDAIMPGHGTISIQTASASFDQAFCEANPGYLPGQFIRLGVADTGCGMDRETLGKMFEPFFTTKEVGRGTGLGLSTVYGIVKQNGGFIDVDSEPGRGTVFNIYLPSHVGDNERAPAMPTPAADPAVGQETILFVEDEPSILALGECFLRRQGYQVLSASLPGEAIRMAERYAGPIHLLITDVVMPEMDGRDLAKNLLRLYPDVKRIYMSGYTADVIAHRGVLDQGVHFIQKPFTMNELAAKVRHVLDS